MNGAVFVSEDMAERWVVQPVVEPEATHPKMQKELQPAQDEKAMTSSEQPQYVTKCMVGFVQATKYVDISTAAETRVR